MNGSNLFVRIVKAAVIVALYAFFFIGAVVLITGCGAESPPPHVVADAPRPNVQIVNIWPDKSNRWPPPGGSPLKQNEGAHS